MGPYPSREGGIRCGKAARIWYRHLGAGRDWWNPREGAAWGSDNYADWKGGGRYFRRISVLISSGDFGTVESFDGDIRIEGTGGGNGLWCVEWWYLIGHGSVVLSKGEGVEAANLP